MNGWYIPVQGETRMTETQRRLRAARAYAGMTLDELADAVGVGRMTLVRMENGKRMPKRMELREIAESTGLPVSFFTLDNDELAAALDAGATSSDHEERITALEANLRDLRRELAGTALRRAAQAAGSSKRRNEDPHEQDHRPGHTGGDDR